MNLVSTNKSNYTSGESNRVDKVKKLYINLGMPRYKKFLKALEKSPIKDCPLTVDNAKICLSVHGKEIAKLNGSKTKK